MNKNLNVMEIVVGVQDHGVLPRGTFRGGEQQETMPKGTFRGGEQQETMPKGTFRGGEQQETMPKGTFRGGEQQETMPKGTFRIDMREFAFGTREQFEALDCMLNDGLCHVYNNCTLPDSCEPNKTRLGFEKNDDGQYMIYVDLGITTTEENEDFKSFIEKGETKCLCIEDMMNFFESFQPIFGEGQRHIVDKEKLKSITDEGKQKKAVYPEEISEPLKKKIFGQDEVIDQLSESIVINRMRQVSRLLVMLFMGPPATGKSETARSLSEILSQIYDRKYGFIEIAGNEFGSEHMVHRFLGAPAGYVGHGDKTVLDPVRENPYHVIVINEIEKSHDRLLIALMEAMDTGFLGMADNSKPIDLRNCILLFTSNLPIDMEKYDEKSEFERMEMCKDVFTKYCGKPEISRRINGFLVFRPLSDDAVVDVFVKFAKLTLTDYNANLVHIDERLMADFLKCGTKYGASEIRNRISLAIGKEILKRRQLDLIKGKDVAIKGTIDEMEFEIV